MSNQRKTWKVGTGGHMQGSATIHGNKNASLPCMAAALLLPLGGRMTLSNMPRISDVRVLAEILEHLGITSTWTSPQTLTFERIANPEEDPHIPHELMARIRGSIVLLGPLSGLHKAFSLPKPGGDKIGGRPIGAHITALTDLGIQVENIQGHLACRRNGPIRGGTIVLTEQSVTATLMMLLYSAFLDAADHLTIIDAACEPHIVSLCNLLTAMGAHIEGIYSNLLTITWPHGRQSPTNPLRIDDDFMEAATYAIAAAITKSDLRIPFSHAGLYLHVINRYLNWMGIATTLTEHTLEVFGSRSTRIIDPTLTTIQAEPWPRFPTDVMSMFVVLATQCTGRIKFVEYMYDDRFGFVQALRDIGAKIEQQPPHAITVTGPTPLSGNELFLRPDIRSGAAMLLAALAADGTTVLHDRGGVIERGYQELPQSLAALGAPIQQLEYSF